MKYCLVLAYIDNGNTPQLTDILTPLDLMTLRTGDMESALPHYKPSLSGYNALLDAAC